MAKPEWGTKRSCPKCSANFYDLTKNPAVCPKCGNAFDPEQVLKKKARRKPGSALDLIEDKALLAGQKKKAITAGGEDEEALDLPEFEDLDIIEDIDDMEDVGEEVGSIKAKPAGTADEEDDDEEGFLDSDDDDLLEEVILEEETSDDDEEDK